MGKVRPFQRNAREDNRDSLFLVGLMPELGDSPGEI